MTRVPNVGVGREDSTFKERQDLRAAVLEAAHLLSLADVIAHLCGNQNFTDGPGPTALSEPTCLARPWAAAWELYVAHAVKQGYAKHLVPRPCAEEPSGSCLPAACAE